MAKIYLIRHGESIANTECRYQGVTYDTPLSKLGKKQARELAKSSQKIKLNKIIASPLLRARQTAEIVAQVKNMKVIVEQKIIETNHGLWEGKHKDDIAKIWPHIYKRWQKFPSSVSFPEGERFLETQQRVIKWWASFIQNTLEDTLIVSHDNIIRIIVAKILNMKLNRIWRFHLQPTAFTVVEITKVGQKLLSLNDAVHLDKIMTNLEVHAL